jgi:hypothetical protein
MKNRINPQNNGSNPTLVKFSSGDGQVAGHLYLPDNYNPEIPCPAVVTAGSFSSVKEMMGGTYAYELSKRGIIGLSIDFRNYGESSGEIRQYEDPDAKAEDFLSAVRYLKENYNVSCSGILSVCSSSNAALYAVSGNDEVDALVTVAGYFMFPGSIGNADKRCRDAEKAKAKYEKTGEIEMVPAYSGTDIHAVNFVPMPYYISKKRGNISQWKNAMAVMAYPELAAVNCFEKALNVKVPTLVIQPTFTAGKKNFQKMYDMLPCEKRLAWMKGTNFDLYDSEESVVKAVDLAAEHFFKHSHH